jgi:hypothetical protein
MHAEDPDLHLTPGQTAAYLDRVLTPEERARVEAHLEACSECRSELVALRPLVASLNTRRNLLRVSLLLGTAAAASVALLVYPGVVTNTAVSPHRDPVGLPAPTLKARAPAGAVSRPATLAWAPLDRATRYRGQVFDAEGSILYRAETEDSVLLLPDSLPLAAGRTYFWKVEADTGWDSWVSSRLVEFNVANSRQDNP